MESSRQSRFAAFYDDNYSAVHRYAACHFGEGEADDIAQETMVRALARFADLDAERSPRAWLFTVARNVGIDGRRRDHTIAVDGDTLEAMAGTVADPLDDVSLRVDVGGVLDRAMDEMADGERRVLLLREVCGFSTADIARFLGTSHAAMRQRVVRARRSFADHYAQLGGSQYPAVLSAPARLTARLRQAAGVPAHPFQRFGERAAGAAVAAVLVTAVVVPAGHPRHVPSPASLPPVADRVVPQASAPLPPHVIAALRRLAHTSPRRPVVHAVRPALMEDFERPGLPGWHVTGTRADRTCATSASGHCSLELVPDGTVSLVRPVDVALPPLAGITAYVGVPLPAAPGGGSLLSLGFAFDTGERLTMTVSARDLTTTLAVGSHDVTIGSAQWLPVVLTVDRVVGDVRLGGGLIGPGLALRLATRPHRLVAVTIAARGATYRVDAIRVSRAGECIDGADNDGDGLVDLADPACGSSLGVSEGVAPQCSDGVDNDGDGRVDYPADPGCYYASLDNESPGCSDGRDDDGDGYTDYPDDPECFSPADDSEQPQCSDRRDDDGDGRTDYPADPGCTSPADDTERACVTVQAAGQVDGAPVAFGACLDPITALVPIAVAHTGDAQRAVAYADDYDASGYQVTCVTFRGFPDLSPCDAAGWRRVPGTHRLLVRADAEAAAAGGTLAVCTASLTVRAGDDTDPVPRREYLLTLCPEVDS